VLLLIECGLLLWAGLMMQHSDRATKPGQLFLSACAVLVGGGLYRLDSALIGMMPGPEYRYFPSVGEMLMTAGFTAFAVLAFIVIVKRFPILTQETR
jgi:Ni/Fe-hydrogenase subunit HybB-like protein